MKYFLRAFSEKMSSELKKDGPYYYSKWNHAASVQWSLKISNAILFDSLDKILEFQASNRMFQNSIIEGKTKKELFELKLKGL